MEVQKHEGQGRLDWWFSEHVRARQHLLYEEPAKCPPPNRRKPPKQDPPMNSSTLHIKGDPQPKGEEPTNKEPKSPACLCCNQAHPLYRCNEFKRKSVPERYEVAKSFKVCFNCLKQRHQVNKCSNKTHCQVTNCKRHHHSLLHYERATPQPPPSQDPQTQPPLTPGNALPYVATTTISKLSRSKYNVCYSGWRQLRHLDKKRHCRQAESRSTRATTLLGKHWK